MILNNATSLHDLRVPPGNRLERAFRRPEGPAQSPHQRPVADLPWKQGNAYRVEIVDYH